MQDRVRIIQIMLKYLFKRNEDLIVLERNSISPIVRADFSFVSNASPHGSLTCREEVLPHVEIMQLYILTQPSQACKADLYDNVCGKITGAGKTGVLLFA